MKRKTQKDYVREQLQTKGSITPKEAQDLCGSMRLAAIIHELRHDEEMDIETRECVCKNRIGGTSCYAKYVLKEN